ncbi:MAG: hypothetical protein U0893_08100 [Chloroflexota bacterium]
MDARQLRDQSLWDQPPGPPAWEHDLDAMLRPSLVVEPSTDVQAAILAAILQATAVPVLPLPAPAYQLPVPGVSMPGMPWPGTPATESAGLGMSGPVTMMSYLLLAAVLVAYAAALSWLNAAVGDGSWLSTLAAQLLAVSSVVVGRPLVYEPLTLLWQLLQQAPWLLLLPLAWPLWERDRASSSAA